MKPKFAFSLGCVCAGGLSFLSLNWPYHIEIQKILDTGEILLSHKPEFVVTSIHVQPFFRKKCLVWNRQNISDALLSWKTCSSSRRRLYLLNVNKILSRGINLSRTVHRWDFFEQPTFVDEHLLPIKRLREIATSFPLWVLRCAMSDVSESAASKT